MANTIQIKRSSTAAAIPTAGQLAVGELAVNLADKKLYSKNAAGTVVELTSPGFVINSLTTADPALGDFLPFADISDSNGPKKATAESVVKAATNATGSAPIYACRAWVNFNGTGTVAIRASGNVSSITDNGTGDYTVNFTTAMPDANYAAMANTDTRSFINYHSASPFSASSIRFDLDDSEAAQTDRTNITVAIFR